ncbi:MAG: AAA family ATPase [Sphingobacteriales bacterium JAD_PAG50586_3]|nr:MAG: AAA family ATPase [Sphingobacteriales bacterium JAD_PAG50586_3]
MPITIRFEKTDENGNTYYEDTNGNRIEEVKPTEEELAAEEAKWERKQAEAMERMEARQRKARPFLLKSLGNLQKPKARKVLWGAPPLNPLPKGEGKQSATINNANIYWAERELCILAGDNGVGKSLMALQVARATFRANEK